MRASAAYMQVVIERTAKEPLAQGGVLCAGSVPTRTAELKRFRGGERRTGSEATRRTASRTRLRSTCAGRCLPFGGGGAHAHRTPRRTARSCRPCSGSRQPNSTPSRSPCAGRRPVRLPGLRRGCQSDDCLSQRDELPVRGRTPARGTSPSPGSRRWLRRPHRRRALDSASVSPGRPDRLHAPGDRADHPGARRIPLGGSSGAEDRFTVESVTSPSGLTHQLWNKNDQV